MRGRLYRLGLCVIFVVLLLLQGAYEPVQEVLAPAEGVDALYVWYTDEALTDYLNRVALTFKEKHNGQIIVVPRLASGPEYLEQIDDSRNTPETADVYLLSNDALGKAYLAGLAVPFEGEMKSLITQDDYPETALRAVTYEDKLVGCPFYYETAIFLCNETYLNQMARTAVAAQADAAEGEAAMQAVASMSDEELAAQVSGNAIEDGTNDAEDPVSVSGNILEDQKAQMIPRMIEDIMNFAETYDAPENVDSILKWDVSDIFFDYFFAGDCIGVGGENGDSKEVIDIYNPRAVEALTLYQQLNQFFSMETSSTTYESVLNDFIEGKTVFTIATTDAVEKLEAVKKEGRFPYDYKVLALPDIRQDIVARSLSVTYATAVSGYTQNRELAQELAVYLTKPADDHFYDKTGKVPAYKKALGSDDTMTAILTEYERSVPLPKLLETGNFWIHLEAVFTRIWNGEDVESELKKLDEQMKGL
ncbi:MAG: extracellular solute-binding protein [Lachnospiraceae bacterium]|nr:extracellular solute-binding protein [Lachnospiraceae bacterium]